MKKNNITTTKISDLQNSYNKLNQKDKLFICKYLESFSPEVAGEIVYGNSLDGNISYKKFKSIIDFMVDKHGLCVENLVSKEFVVTQYLEMLKFGVKEENRIKILQELSKITHLTDEDYKNQIAAAIQNCQIEINFS